VADIPSSVDPRYARVYTSLQKSTAAGHVGYTTWTFWGGKADTYITGNIDKVLTGNLSAADFCAGVDAAFKSDKQRGLIPTAVAPTG
jgi:raffinose/stachyose/melibiose transport system substrate-binding protein